MDESRMEISIKKIVGLELPTFYKQLGLEEAFSVVMEDGCKNLFPCYADAADLVANLLLHRRTTAYATIGSERPKTRNVASGRITNRTVEHQMPRSVWWMVHTSGMRKSFDPPVVDPSIK